MYNQAKPKILIGQDNWHLLVATETRKGHRNQPAASLTPLGWVLHGIRTRTIGQHVHYVHNLTATTEDNMDEQLRRYFAIESLAITPKRPSNDPEQRAVNILKESTTQLEDGHYQTGLLWKEQQTKMPNNYENAMKRTEKSIDLHTENSSERVLGLNWNSDRDELTFNRLPHDIMNSERPTKRQVLKIVMSLFDPLGLASPVTTKAKQLQEIWRRGTGWDDEIDQDLATQYTDATTLHTFVDASETAYAAALYWRATDSRGHVSTSIIAKSRVAPLKITSIPRLELQAAVMGTRMATTVIEEHDRKPNTKFYWTDSKTVLTWLKNGARSYKPFVAHRIAAIEENSTLNEWRWVPTKQNVADDATRNTSKFRSMVQWATARIKRLADRKTYHFKGNRRRKILHLTVKKPDSNILECIPNIDKFSKWSKLIRSTACVLQFIRLCRKNGERIGRADAQKCKTSADIKRRSPITRLYIEHTHRQLHHAGAEATINECRQRYYITRIRTVTRDIIRRCIPCRIKRASPPHLHGDHLSTGWHITDARSPTRG
ncbi:hypothetical protein EVAR_88208_1 [Eumeta japonica]|uniref:Integrase zinc-binding domain-containing protein n=1 Tax=Eumeta variegata TaxID=151549 RepID=A0A4C1ST52_EUMVA|nr:hypothetical protein EVAR_88208_1 [Eumeta japonica]